MPGNEEKLLKEAIARNSGAVVSFPSAGMLRHCKSRFFAEQDEGLLVESPAGQTALIEQTISSNQIVLCAFKNGIYKIAFATNIIRPVPQWPVSQTIIADALLLARPQKIQTLQRREYYRARVFQGSAYRARVWRIAEHAYMKDVPPRAQEVQCELRDLSVGGIGARFASKDGKPPKISVADRLRIEIVGGEQSVVVEGRMREPHKAPDGNAAVAGIVFKELGDDIDDRRTFAQLTRIVGDLQGEELRQHRMTLAQTG